MISGLEPLKLGGGEAELQDLAEGREELVVAVEGVVQGAATPKGLDRILCRLLLIPVPCDGSSRNNAATNNRASTLGSRKITHESLLLWDDGNTHKQNRIDLDYG